MNKSAHQAILQTFGPRNIEGIHKKTVVVRSYASPKEVVLKVNDMPKLIDHIHVYSSSIGWDNKREIVLAWWRRT